MEPIQLLEVEGQEFKLSIEALKEKLNGLGWLDKKIAFIPVCGQFRGGKSFLLNFLLRYLHHQQRVGAFGGSCSVPMQLHRIFVRCTQRDWLTSSGKTIADGFAFRGGPQRHTTGISCSEPFLVQQTSPTGEHDEVVILISDCQGLFDNLSGNHVNQMLFVLSAIISSTMIYNISENIDKNDWDLLSKFVHYAKIVNDVEENGQKMETKLIESLLILVRDWNDPALEFGYEGGNEYLREEMEESGTADDILQGRYAVRDVCDELRCYLMPHPGSKVASDQFRGGIKDICPAFLEQLRVFVPSLLSPTKIRPKHFNGQPLTCAAWLNLFKEENI